MKLPLGLRNRLAELVVAAFDEPPARETLEALAAFCRGRAPLEPEAAARLRALGWFEEASPGLALRGAHRPFRAALCRRVERALAALRARAPLPAGDAAAALLARAARLADVGLYFEVHELLEPAWMRADGPARLALQGLIQIAVGLQHADHGNRAGASSLLREGLARLAAARHALPLETRAWEARLAELADALEGGEPLPPPPAWPRPEAAAWRSS